MALIITDTGNDTAKLNQHNAHRCKNLMKMLIMEAFEGINQVKKQSNLTQDYLQIDLWIGQIYM